jgi:YgiT-type zinc finger domain-containing protein
VGDTFKKEGREMKCFECGGEVIQLKTALVFYRKDKTPVFFEDVPVGECKQCGEKYVSGLVSGKISEFLEAKTIKAKEHLKVPVIRLAA